MTFLPDFKKFLLNTYPTSPLWAESIALSVLATAVGRERSFHTKIGPMKLNLFFLNIGPSRLAYKSVPLRYCAVPMLIKLGELADHHFVLPSRYTMEGLIEYMKDFSSEGCIIRDEFTSQFKDVQKKQYLAEGMEFLSELYDGMLQKRYTKSSKLEELREVYIVYLTATTPYIFSVMERNWFIQGTGNRFLFILDKPKQVDGKYNKKLYSIDFDSFKNNSISFFPFVKRLIEIRKNAPNLIAVQMGEALNLLSRFKTHLETKAYNLYQNDTMNIQYGYVANCAEFVSKIAALQCISRNEWSMNSLSEDKYLFISLDDVKYAITKIKRYMNQFYKLMNMWGTVSEPAPVVTAKRDYDYVLSIIEQNGGEIGVTSLHKSTGYMWGKYQRIINSMLASNLIIAKQLETGKRGRKPIVYYIP